MYRKIILAVGFVIVLLLSSCAPEYGGDIMMGVWTEPGDVHVNETVDIRVSFTERFDIENTPERNYKITYVYPGESEVHELYSHATVFKDVVFEKACLLDCHFSTNYQNKEFKDLEYDFIINVNPAESEEE